jgi:hypothetical protein
VAHRSHVSAWPRLFSITHSLLIVCTLDCCSLLLLPLQVMDFLGSAAFSQAVQALDTATGTLVCLKIIKNNKVGT